ncbi:exodeoxyribonuclease VII large subunit [Aliiglaciecola sp. CAU 1673]|uniref:exodeoxyribonuclease VII large subunit n=1 Tax=Aliiglaciecola sp. CAU 1673 TaxID=3032595 RepID=UPI0023DAEF17|nr:exodeoxyribonuclease VII large subunit [Aliiglaciecola sp. CAU 1673]MDF2178942.1 exodeoxyribonuclease VII large subunit [Aliiglaciecola sp. CAU 1673]
MQQNNHNILTVSHLNRLARQVLEMEIGQVWVRAEISNFVAASSGHWYFTLKDDRAQVRAAMFKMANRRVTMRPQEGDRVLVRGSLGLYEPRGDYQLIVEHLEPEGEGLLKQQFEQLKQKLLAQGLFDSARKRPLPSPILKVGVVTSPTGAAIHDILTVLKRRNPAIEVILYPSQVQGETAPAQLIRAIQTANQRNEVDLLIVGRGGGSLEDLWCFNDEALAYAIYASNLPIISAVGHEVDVSIADFVADLRAPTPSAAAELVSRDKAELEKSIQQLGARLVSLTQHRLSALGHRHEVAAHRLQRYHPEARLLQQAQQLDRLSAELSQHFAKRLSDAEKRSNKLQERLGRLSPERRLDNLTQRLGFLEQSLQKSVKDLLQGKGQALAENSHLLNSVSPLATLSRGYSISLKDGKAVKKAAELKSGDRLTTKFVDGEVVSLVEK